MLATFADNPRKKALRESRAGAAKLFTDFGVRVFVLALDVLVIYLAAAFLVTGLPFFATRVHESGMLVLMLVLLPTYFTLSWTGPLNATPLQWLFGMRVTDLRGQPLPFGRAALRAFVLLAMVAAALAWFDDIGRDWLLGFCWLASGLALLAALTPNRQGAHDLLAGSIVVNRRFVAGEKNWRYVEEIASRNDAAGRSAKRPTIPRMASDSIAMVLGVLVLTTMLTVAHDKNLRARAYYAFLQTDPLRTAVAEFYTYEGRWPRPGDDLGADVRGEYPDGGYYELLDEGVVRIAFTVDPDLSRGGLSLVPAVIEGNVEWDCNADGNIPRRYLPAHCRD